MTLITFNAPTEADIHYVAEHMVNYEVAELAALGKLPLPALLHGVKVSTECFTVCNNGVPFAIFGIVPDSILGDRACVWCLVTHRLAHNKRAVAFYAPRIIRDFTTRYPVLYNRIHEDNTISMKWLKRLGFTFGNKINNFIPFSNKV